MKPVDYALLARLAYTDAPTVGNADSASRMHVYGDVHCFRGTDDMASVLSDADIRAMSVPGLGKVHAGFYNALGAILPVCLSLNRPRAVTGHSLGAAMAILYAAVLATLGHVVEVYAFEPPRLCADDVLAKLLLDKKVPFYATRNGHDLVTQVPLGMTLPGLLTVIGKPSAPFDNITDHDISRVVSALSS